jgi:hypothetical protein
MWGWGVPHKTTPYGTAMQLETRWFHVVIIV